MELETRNSEPVAGLTVESAAEKYEAATAPLGSTGTQPNSHGDRLDQALSLDRQFRADRRAEMQNQLRDAESQERDGVMLCKASLNILGWAFVVGFSSAAWFASIFGSIGVLIGILASIAFVGALILLPIGGITIMAARSRSAMLLLKARRLEIDVHSQEDAG